MQELEEILEEIKEALEENKVIELNGDGTVNDISSTLHQHGVP